MKRSTFRHRRHTKLNDQLPPFGQTNGPRFVIVSPGPYGRRQQAHLGVQLNRGTGEGTARAIARERARS